MIITLGITYVSDNLEAQSIHNIDSKHGSELRPILDKPNDYVI